MEKNSTNRLPGVNALLHMVPANVSYPSFPPALALQTQDGYLYPIHCRPPSAEGMDSKGYVTPESSTPSPRLGMQCIKLEDSQMQVGHELQAMAADTLASASSTPATSMGDLVEPQRKVKAARVPKVAKERVSKKSAKGHTTTPGVMHTALPHLRITKRFHHKKTEFFRRAISHELTAATISALGLDAKSAQAFATALSKTSSSSKKNDNGLSDNQSREAIARATTALIGMILESGYTFEDVYARMDSAETTARVTARAAIARRERPIEAEKFPGVHPEDIAKLVAHGFVTYDVSPKKHGREEDDSDGEYSDRSTKSKRTTRDSLPTIKSRL